MVEVRPFRGLRFGVQAGSDLAALLSPPYDVLSPQDQESLHQRSPHNIVRLELGKVGPEDTPENNRYLVVTQLWIKGERGFRRPDVLLYVNGIPLVFIELKNSNVKLRNAYDDNLTTYKAEIPQLFLTNAFCVLSNAIETKVGSITAEWEHFFNWLRADDEKQKIDRKAIREQGISLEGVIEGLLPRKRLLDYVENFILYYKDSSKIIAQNHQFIGVKPAY